MVAAGATGGGILSPASIDLLRGSAYVSTGAPYSADASSVAGTSSLVEVALKDGQVRFRDQLPSSDQPGIDLNSAPLLLGRLACATAKDGVWAWDRVARKRLWHAQLTPAAGASGEAPGPTDGPEGGPLATDGLRLYVLSNDGAAGRFAAAALEPTSGTVLWRQDLPAYAFAAPAVAGGTLFTASAAGTLHALRTHDGALLDEAELGAPSAGAVASARGRVLAGVGAAPYLPGEHLICLG
jgi:outer membrane protein assembly factor BamB